MPPSPARVCSEAECLLCTMESELPEPVDAYLRGFTDGVISVVKRRTPPLCQRHDGERLDALAAQNVTYEPHASS
jgi:hypothetical protein